MHGRFRREGEETSTSSKRSIYWHMHSAVTAADSNSFYKDGRRISIGDCALFKPPQDSPPFIGLIRWLTLSEENCLQLGVNWLYRPAELKLGKGTLLDSAPNEIFYSFHKDEIPAASLLHPCKVAFLPRGVELPKGTSSFICRRVYDIANKHLWWLTDQDYIDERQEEVDQLLYKTRSEMHATLQAGGRSPKQVNGPTSTSQLKPGSDNSQNSGNSCPSHGKGKKRERGDHGADPVKRERSSRIDDGDSAHYKTEGNMKTQISRINERGVVDLEGVERLVQLMQHDKLERKLDLSSRSMLASVIASIDKVDCLSHFVQLRGLPVLDEWLQDVHKGKIDDGNAIKDGDKSVEGFLLVLLRALDKLPVNLQALQMCNIGRSVNHLRSHKNIEIQRKARALVDTWKKRVEAEMISIDAKSSSTQAVVSWPSKSRHPEVSHGSRTPSGSDIAVKSSVCQNSSAKTTSLRHSLGENNIKHVTTSGPAKLASSPPSGNESQPRTSVGGIAVVPQIREDRSSSSNQSHNGSQPCSPKEDLKSSPSSTGTIIKTSNISTRNRKVSGFSGIIQNGSQKETGFSKSPSANKGTVVEKSHSALTSEKVLEGPVTEGNSHKLIVKIPNSIRSSAQGVTGGCLEDSAFMSSQASSPVLSDKHEKCECASPEKIDAHQCGVISSVNTLEHNEQKAVLSESVGVEPPAVVPDEEQSITPEDSKGIIKVTPTTQMEPVKLQASFCHMDGVTESCFKNVEVTSSLPIEDDVGMNLLASVAAGEMSRVDAGTPTDCVERSSPKGEEPCTCDGAKSMSSIEDYDAGVQNQSCNGAECDGKKQTVLNGCLRCDEGLQLSKHAPVELLGNRKCALSDTPEDVPAEDDTTDNGSPRLNFPGNSECKLEICEKPKENTGAKLEICKKPKENTGATSSGLLFSIEEVRYGEPNEQIHDGKATSSNVIFDSISNCASGEIDGFVTEEKNSTDHKSIDVCNQMVELAASKPLNEGDCDTFLTEGLYSQLKLTAERANNEKLHHTECGQKPASQDDGEKDGKSCSSKSERLNLDKEVDKSAAGLCSTSHDLTSHHKEAIAESDEIQEPLSLSENRRPGSADPDTLEDAALTGSKSASIHPVEAGECTTGAETTSPATHTRASDTSAKITFDLNKGFGADDEKHGESVTLTATGSEIVHTSNSLPSSLKSVHTGHCVSITVAAAAKGPFVPHEDLLRSKAELGWKGSAATSAFRPAEPRKVIELPLGPEASANKHDRAPLDFDLNVPDEKVLEEMASRGPVLAVDSTNNCKKLLNKASNTMPLRGFGGLDLDLNRVDGTNGSGQFSTDSNHKSECSIVRVEPLGVLPAGDVKREFDLNGPVADDTSVEQFSISQLGKGSIMTQPPSTGLRMNSPGLGSFSSWFPPGNTHSAVAIPSILPDQGRLPVPIFPTGGVPQRLGQVAVAPFNPDMYRGSVLSMSPAIPFTSSPFQFPFFPFGTPVPLPSATFSVGATSYADSSSAVRHFSPVNSQFPGPFGSTSSQFQRPYVVNLPDNSNTGGPESKSKWDIEGFDLNAGPGAMETEVRGRMPLSSGQHSIAGSQALAGEQARIFSVSDGILKRKEPEGGWDGETLRHKQSSWQ